MFKKKQKRRVVKVNYYSSTKNSIRRKPKTNRVKRPLLKFLTSILVILAIYLGFFSNFFIISKVVNINDELTNQALADQINGSISSALDKNLIFINTQDLAQKIIDSFPELEQVKVTKSYPKTIKVQYSEFPLSANIINESSSIKKTYVVNTIGFAIKENYENPNLPYIKIISDEPINTEKAVIDKTKLKYILDTKAFFEDKFGMTIKEIEYKPVAREIHLLTEKDFYIWLDIQQDYEEQLRKLKKALVKLNIFEENLWYIDLRIAGNNGDKIIYKRRQ